MPTLPLKVAAALAVPLLGLGELAAHVYFARRAPTPDEWQAARPVVAALHLRGDVVVVAPYWAEPLARWKFGDELMPIREVARPDATRYARAIEVSALGARSGELAGWRVASETRAGKITVRVLENPAPAAVRYDFTDHVKPGDAEAEQVHGGTVTACAYSDHAPVEASGLGGAATFPAERFSCGGGPAFAGVTIIDCPSTHPRRCIWTYPTNGAEAVVRFPHVPLGSTVRGHMGLSYLVERDEPGPPMQLRVLVDGAPIGTADYHDNETWKSFEFPTGAHGGRLASVEFRVTSATGASRELCFEADTR